MKVAMVSEHASPLATLGGVDAGGQNVHVAALSRALAALGHDVAVYTRRDDPALPARVELCERVTVEHVEAGPAEPIPKDAIFPHVGQLASGLRKAWRSERPDVVHAHFWMSGLAALQAARRLDLPVVQTFHALGSVKRRFQGTKDTSPPERIVSEVAITRRAERIVATCSDELFELSRLGADVGRISIVPCGVDTDLFRPACPPCPGLPPPAPGRRRLVTIGRLVERKGIDDVIKALASVPEAELVVAGGPDAAGLDDDADARRLAALARRCGVADRVVLTGRLDRPTVAALLATADMAICAPWYEPFGIVPLEAMACAVPVVASAVGGLSDTVVDGVTGLHVPSRRPAAIAAAARRLLDDPGWARTLGAAGRARAVEKYQWSSVARSTLGAYARACPAPRQGSDAAVAVAGGAVL